MSQDGQKQEKSKKPSSSKHPKMSRSGGKTNEASSKVVKGNNDKEPLANVAKGASKSTEQIPLSKGIAKGSTSGSKDHKPKKSKPPSSENPGNNAKSGDKKKSHQGKRSSADKASSHKKSPATSGTFAQLADKILTQVKEMFPTSQKGKPKSKPRKSKPNCRTESKKSAHGGKHHSADKKHSKMGRSQSKSPNSGTGHFFELEITNGGEKRKKGKVSKTFARLPLLTPTGGCGQGGCPEQKHTKTAGKSGDPGEKKGKPASKKSGDPKKPASAPKPTKDTASTKKKPSTCKLVSGSKGQHTNSKTGKGSDKEKKSKDKKTK